MQISNLTPVKVSEFDKEGHPTNLAVWDYIVTYKGVTRQIEHDDMVDLQGSEIARHATKEEILQFVIENPRIKY